MFSQRRTSISVHSHMSTGTFPGPREMQIRENVVPYHTIYMHNRTTPERIAIVGAGVAGLTAALRHRQAGVGVQVFECAGQPGGRTLTVRRNGFAFDVGAITLLPTYEETTALIDELGLASHLHRVRPVIGIPRGGGIHDLDLSHPVRSVLRTPLLSAGTKLRLLRLLPAMRQVWPLANFRSMAPLAPWDHEPVAEFARRVLGEEAHEYLAGPVMRGNTLNDTACAPAAEFLWMLRQYAAASISGLDTGINGLAEELARRVPVEYGTRVVRVTCQDGRVAVDGVGAAGEFSRPFDACIVALAPPDLLALGPPMSEGQRRFLQSVQSLPSVGLHVGLRRAPPLRQTFILPPQSEQRNLTTIVLDHLKAPGRAPQGQGVMTFMLRDDWCAAHMDREDRDIRDEVLALARPFVGDLRSDVDTYVVQRWRYANVKSHVGLYRGMQGYEEALDASSPVQLAGDFLSQGIEAAVISGQAAARRLLTRLHPSATPIPVVAFADAA
jgi:oxygen-dependent protoporphyrinogen oxidase